MAEGHESDLQLHDGSRVAVIGGGPAGSFFSYFLLQTAERAGLALQLDLYEPRDFAVPGPAGCNMCGGVISESLVQHLAAEGINLPSSVVQRGIDSYLLHMDVGNVRIDTPLHEKRIAAVYRGAGPRGIQQRSWNSFDGHLLKLAAAKGARWVRARVESVALQDGRPQLKPAGRETRTYDLLVIATGVNTSAGKMLDGLGLRYRAPRTTKTHIAELCIGRERIATCFGTAMHVFLLNLSRLEFAALVPKGDYVTFCLLGEDIDKSLIETFMSSREVGEALPSDWREPADFCHCSPKINIRGAIDPFADRVVFVGDCGVSRLYKDGIGAAYRCAKAAAVTAVFNGISAEDFRRYYAPLCRTLARDNLVGKAIFLVTRLIQKRHFLRRGLRRMLLAEQRRQGEQRAMSGILWDTFTGSAPYGDVLRRALRPSFLVAFAGHIVRGFWSEEPAACAEERNPQWKQAS